MEQKFLVRSTGTELGLRLLESIVRITENLLYREVRKCPDYIRKQIMRTPL